MDIRGRAVIELTGGPGFYRFLSYRPRFPIFVNERRDGQALTNIGERGLRFSRGILSFCRGSAFSVPCWGVHTG